MGKKRITILGSTGSIGTQALDVIREHGDLFEAYALTANNNVDLLARQAKEFEPESVVIANKEKYKELKNALCGLPIKVWAGSEAVSEVAAAGPAEVVLTAVVGFSGLRPTIEALKAKKTIALANKETLVVGGDLVTRLALENKACVLPVDSEHSAIFQCLNGETGNPIDKILLTASGGPFRTLSREELSSVTKEMALKHPTWVMGAKVTIDSASMMNKGFEMIEAKWLFGVSPSRIQVIVHPQSVIHSMVQFKDTSVIAQMGIPDMRLPIQYAFSYPERLASAFFKEIDFFKLGELTFEPADRKKFRNLDFAYIAAEKGGNMPCILNAANEIAVDAFLKDKTSFTKMSDIIENTMQKATFVAVPEYEDYVKSDLEARKIAEGFI